MRRNFTGLLALVLFFMPAIALAHGGPAEGVYHQTVKAGPYTLILDFTDWPLTAKKSNRIIIAPQGGIEGMSATMTLVPPDGQKPTTVKLHPYPGIKDAWMFETAGLRVEGPWSLNFAIDGPAGPATGTTGALTVAPPPGMPMWAGWLIGLFPLYGLAWFGVREVRRVQSLMATADERIGA